MTCIRTYGNHSHYFKGFKDSWIECSNHDGGPNNEDGFTCYVPANYCTQPNNKPERIDYILYR